MTQQLSTHSDHSQHLSTATARAADTSQRGIVAHQLTICMRIADYCWSQRQYCNKQTVTSRKIPIHNTHGTIDTIRSSRVTEHNTNAEHSHV